MTGQAPPTTAAAAQSERLHPLGRNAQELTNVLQFDPTTEVVNSGVMADALKEITEERNQKIKAKAKEQLIKAMDLQTKMKNLKKQFDTEMQKCDKELGKIMRNIKGAMEGKSIEEVEEADKAKE